MAWEAFFWQGEVVPPARTRQRVRRRTGAPKPRRSGEFSSPACFAHELGEGGFGHSAAGRQRAAPDLRIKRIYEDPGPGDGYRVLVDRLWPRGIRKEQAAVHVWARDLAPSTELLKWFAHDPRRWDKFRQRYAAELSEHPGELIALRRRAAREPVTLLYAARDPQINHARVLRELILGT
jgi:uncharacterized protein YeaO (DUF488 family)